MANVATISKEHIIEHALDLALSEGPSALNMRNLAQHCDIATGSLYNYFPNKGQLICEVMRAFWARTIHDDMMSASSPNAFIPFCLQLERNLRAALASLDHEWFVQLSSLDTTSKAHALDQEQKTFAHIKASIARVAKQDQCICTFCEQTTVSPEQLAQCIWDALYESLRYQSDTFTVLMQIITFACNQTTAGECLLELRQQAQDPCLK